MDEVYFKEGERVKKGDIIIKFSDYKGREVEEKLNEKKQELAVKNSQLRYLKQQEKDELSKVERDFVEHIDNTAKRLKKGK